MSAQEFIAVKWRVTAEYDDYERARDAHLSLARSGWRSVRFVALDVNGDEYPSIDFEECDE